MLLTPLDESSTQVTMIANVDPKLDYVPYGIINLVRESVGSIGVPVRTLMCGQVTHQLVPLLFSVSTIATASILLSSHHITSLDLQMFAAVAKTVFQSEYEARIAEDKNGFYSTIRRRLALFSRNKSEPCQ